MNSPELQQKTFLLLLIAVSLAFGWILLPFFGAVFWGTILAILFAPLYRRLLAVSHQRQNLAALTTVFLCLIMVILPLTLMTAALVQEAVALYQRIRTGELNFGAYFQQIMSALPSWVTDLLNNAGVTSISDLTDMLSNIALQASQIVATEALAIGQNTLEFIVSFVIMLYLLYFLLRAGAALSARIKQAIPLNMEHKRYLFRKFTTVVRATVKGNLAVAVVQGTLGGMMFSFLDIRGALLWGFIMGLLSLLPAGAGLIWVPVAIYFLLTGALWQGITLIVFGALVIGLVDNLLRPLLVGKDTQIPDYVILITTLGGIVFFGVNGFIIGPVIAALFIASWDLFSSTKKTPED
ncbi:MAG: AI-2E family transporter [Nitrosospira sp.]|nr:AI-2E family transporter [Nitrosospira sp.]